MRQIKFCGNCNPDVDPRSVKKIIESTLLARTQDRILVVHGCSRECLSRTPFFKENKEDLIVLKACDVVKGG